MSERKLTAKQARFVEEYQQDSNATQAAIRAGYSMKTANQIGPKLLVNVGVRAAIDALRADRSKRLEISADKVLLEVARCGFSDIRNYFDGGRLRPVADLDDDAAAAIREIVPTKFGTALKLHSKDAALEKLCKHLGLYKADVNLLPVVPFFEIIYPDGYKPPIDAEPVEAVPVRAVEHEGEVAYTPLPPLPEDG